MLWSPEDNEQKFSVSRVLSNAIVEVTSGEGRHFLEDSPSKISGDSK